MQPDRFNCGFRGAKRCVYEGGIRAADGAALARRRSSRRAHADGWCTSPTGCRRCCGAAGAAVADLALDGVDVRRCCAASAGASASSASGSGTATRRRRVQRRDARRRWKLVRPAIDELMQVTDEDRVIDKALNYRGPDAITEVDRSPLPEFDIGEPPRALLFDLAADPFEQDDLAASVHAGRHHERSARGMVRLGRGR